MYLPAKFGGHKSYGSGDIDYYISYYMDTLEKVELTASINHIAKFLKLEIPIWNSEVPAENREEGEEEERQLQSIIRFAQTQKKKSFGVKILNFGMLEL